MSCRIAAIIPVHNGIRHTLATVRTLLELLPRECTVVVVDDGSTDGTTPILKAEYPEVVVLAGNGSLWWSGAINRGARFALKQGYDYVLFLNNDIVVHEQFLKELLRGAQEFPGALIASKILNADEPWKVWSAGGKVNWVTGKFWMLGCNLPDDRYREESIEVDWLPGMSVLVPIEVFRKGIFVDERAFPQYAGDADFSMRARKAGYRLIVWPKSIVYNKVRNSGMLSKLLLSIEPVSWKLVSECLTSIKSSAAFNTFGRLILRQAPFWAYPITLGRFYGFLFLKIVQISIKLPGPGRWLNKRRFAAFARNKADQIESR